MYEERVLVFDTVQFEFHVNGMLGL